MTSSASKSALSKLVGKGRADTDVEPMAVPPTVYVDQPDEEAPLDQQDPALSEEKDAKLSNVAILLVIIS
jgi:hypothetical protein